MSQLNRRYFHCIFSSSSTALISYLNYIYHLLVNALELQVHAYFLPFGIYIKWAYCSTHTHTHTQRNKIKQNKIKPKQNTTPKQSLKVPLLFMIIITQKHSGVLVFFVHRLTLSILNHRGSGKAWQITKELLWVSNFSLCIPVCALKASDLRRIWDYFINLLQHFPSDVIWMFSVLGLQRSLILVAEILVFFVLFGELQHITVKHYRR